MELYNIVGQTHRKQHTRKWINSTELWNANKTWYEEWNDPFTEVGWSMSCSRHRNIYLLLKRLRRRWCSTMIITATTRDKFYLLYINWLFLLSTTTCTLHPSLLHTPPAVLGRVRELRDVSFPLDVPSRFIYYSTTIQHVAAISVGDWLVTIPKERQHISPL